MSDKITYTVTEPNEDPQKSVIAKRGADITFTMQELDDHKKRVEGIVKELKAKMEMDAAAVKNIEEHHPWVKDFDKKKLHTIGMYVKSLEVVNQIEPKLKEIEEQLDEHQKEVDEIIKQTGYVHKEKDDEENNKEEVDEKAAGSKGS